MDEDVRNLLEDHGFREYAALTKEREFNVFDVLRYSDYEIRHSNVLKWLLTPGATHGVRDAFVKKFVECLEHDGKLAGLNLESTFAHDDVRVEREVDYVDIKVFFEKEPRLLLVVENKPCPFLPEYAEQLRRYVKEQRKKHGAKYCIQGVLLTASCKGDPQHEDYLHLSWHEIQSCVESVLNGRESLSVEVNAFLQQYVDIVDRNILGRGPSSDCFRRLLKDHGAMLEKMLREWKPGKIPKKWPVPRTDVDALDCLLRDFRQRPADLRDAVRQVLRSRGFETQVHTAPGGTAYWLSFWDRRWLKTAKTLGIKDQSWWFEFTHRSVVVKLGGGEVAGEKLRVVRRILRFMEQAPVEGIVAGEFPLEVEGSKYPRLYRQGLVTEAELANASAEESRERTLRRVRRFLNSPDYKRINRYFEVLAFRPSS